MELQLTMTLTLVLISSSYLGWRALKTWKGKSAGCAKGCGCSKKPSAAATTKGPLLAISLEKIKSRPTGSKGDADPIRF